MIDKGYFETLKQQKETQNHNSRVKSINQMIQKEKIYDILYFMKRSVNLDSVKEKLKKFRILSPVELDSNY